MKKNFKLIVTIFSLFFISNVKAEWKKDSVTTLPYVTSTAIVNNNLRFALSGQYIFKTTDAGRTWQKDSVEMDKTLFAWFSYESMTFVNETTGFIQCNMSDMVFVFKTIDAGVHWQKQLSYPGTSEEKIKFVSESKWISNTGRNVRVSDNAGETWQDIHNIGSDTIICNFELINSIWYVFTTNNGSDIRLFFSNDNGKNWISPGILRFYDDLGKSFIGIRFVGITQASRGLVVLYNIMYPGCGMYYHHSIMFDISLSSYGNNNWNIRASNIDFNYVAPTSLYFRNDTGYITTESEIYKLLAYQGGYWFKTFKTESYGDGRFDGIGYVNGILMAYTSNGTTFRNENPCSDKNLAIESFGNVLEGVSVYPNPTSDVITFRFNSIGGDCLITMTDMNGRQVYKGNFEPGREVSISAGFLSAGFYFYTVQSGQHKAIGKIRLIK